MSKKSPFPTDLRNALNKALNVTFSRSPVRGNDDMIATIVASGDWHLSITWGCAYHYYNYETPCSFTFTFIMSGVEIESQCVDAKKSVEDIVKIVLQMIPDVEASNEVVSFRSKAAMQHEARKSC